MVRLGWDWRITHALAEAEIAAAVSPICSFSIVGERVRAVMENFLLQLLGQARVQRICNEENWR